MGIVEPLHSDKRFISSIVDNWFHDHKLNITAITSAYVYAWWTIMRRWNIHVTLMVLICLYNPELTPGGGGGLNKHLWYIHKTAFMFAPQMWEPRTRHINPCKPGDPNSTHVKSGFRVSAKHHMRALRTKCTSMMDLPYIAQVYQI